MHLASFSDLSVAEYIISYEPGTLNKVPGTLFALIVGKRSLLSSTRGSTQMRRFSYSVSSFYCDLAWAKRKNGRIHV